MRNWVVVISLGCILLSVGALQAQTHATTEDGKKVILNADGTWHYAEEIAAPSSAAVFRKVRWGMSRAQVKSTEPGKPAVDDPSGLCYTGTVSGMDALIIYRLVDDKLVAAGYSFTPEHTNKNDYISDYESIKRSVIQKYGPAKSDDSDWRDDLYKDDPSQWGFAVSLGHLVYRTVWETGSTQIIFGLSGENYEVKLQIFYYSMQHAGLFDQDEQKKRNGEF